MMIGKRHYTGPRERLALYAWILAGGWTIFILILASWNIIHIRSTVRELARNEAFVDFNWMLVVRRWAAYHGGVYVPADERTPPNPYLSVPERDLTAPSGKRLTLVNPAYMTRQLFEWYQDDLGVIGHLTSLKPIRPLNAPDVWERGALEEFERGAVEKLEFTEREGRPYIRLMRPLLVEKPCLKCHAVQGYKEGQIRGGLSISIPLDGYLAREKREVIAETARAILIWIIGLAGLGFGHQRLGQSIAEQEAAQGRLAEAQRIAHIGCWELDLAKNILDWSDEIYLIFEIDPKKFGASYEAFLDTVHPEDRANVDFAYTNSVKTKTPYAIDHRLLFPDGRIKYVHEKCETFYDKDGKPLRSVGTVQDITDRKLADEALREYSERLEENEKRLSAITETAPDAIVCIKPGDIAYLWNRKAEEMFGYTAEEVVGKEAHPRMVPENKIKEARAGLETFFKTGEGPLVGKTVELTAHRRDNSEFPVELSVSAMRIKDEWHSTAIIRDITERKKAEEELAKHVDELERYMKATVQREFRVKELRDENERLKAKLKEMGKG